MGPCGGERRISGSVGREGKQRVEGECYAFSIEGERDCGQQMEVAEVFSVFFKRQLRCLERGLPAKIANLTNKVIVNVNSLIISTFFFIIIEFQSMVFALNGCSLCNIRPKYQLIFGVSVD